MDEEEDISLEPAEEEESEARAEEKLARVRQELEAVRKEKQENLDGWQRAKADYVNALRRFEEEKKTERMRGKLEAVQELLPAFDSLERAKEHGELPEGFSGIARQLEQAFAALGLESIGVEGEPFDPAKHEAFGIDESGEDAEEDTVTAVLEKGWKVGGTVIRPAKVRVSRRAPVS